MLDPVPALSEALQGYQMSRGGSRGELVTYSRYPILASSELDMGGIARALDTRVSVEGRPLRILNLHMMTGDPTGKLKTGSRSRFRFLNVTAESRRIQFDALSQIVAREELPTLLLGDFNTPPNSLGHRLMSRSMTDSFGAVGAGFGYTFRADIPVWRIDYIWSKGLLAQSSRVLHSPLSDIERS